jgi:hypothetical protein
MTKHRPATPLPWKVVQSNYGKRAIVSADQGRLDC